MPLWAFDLLYRSRLARMLLYFYGFHVFHYSYGSRDGDNWKYWMSRESLYWHLWRQTDVDDLTEVLSRPEIKEVLSDPSITAIEVGFGIGKNYGAFFRRNSFRRYIASEPNVFACEYARGRFRDRNLVIESTSVEDIIRDSRSFDALLVCGGVFMCLPKRIVDEFFQSLPNRGVKFILITNEGTPGQDIVRADNTAMYNFRERLESAGYRGKRFLEKGKESGIYAYFVMC